MLPADSPFAPLPAPGPHPATAELRAYAAGTLSPAEEHRIEAHALDCERCAELVEGFSMSDAATTDRAVAELRARLQTRVAVPRAAPTWAWPRLAAAAALVGVVAAGLWGLEQRNADSATTTAVAVRPEATRPAAPAPAAAPAPPVTVPAAPRPEAVAAAPATAEVAEAQNATYAAVSQAPARRSGRLSRAMLRPANAPAVAAAAPATEQLALADTREADKSVAAAAKQEVAAVTDAAGAKDQLSEVAVAPAAPDAARRLKRQVAPADSTSAQSVANQRMASKAKARVMGVAAPALSGVAAGRAPATTMPLPAAINPAPVGGMGELREYIRKAAVEFEPEARAMRLTGYVHVKFTVGPDGKLSDFKVTRGLRDDYDAEAIRIISEGPAWQPGVAGGRRAPLPMEVTVPF